MQKQQSSESDSRGDATGSAGAWRDKEHGLLHGAARTAGFWGRASGIYAAYKVAQLRAAALRAVGKSDKEVEQTVWVPQHTWAGEQMYDLCVGLRGFYLKVSVLLPAASGCGALCRHRDQRPGP